MPCDCFSCSNESTTLDSPLGSGFDFLQCEVWLSDMESQQICVLYILFDLVCLAAFWTFSLRLSMDFIFFKSAFFSTQGTFDGGGHLISIL